MTWFKAPYAPKCKVCSKVLYDPVKVTDGTSSDYPYCEKCADTKIEWLNSTEPRRD